LIREDGPEGGEKGEEGGDYFKNQILATITTQRTEQKALRHLFPFALWPFDLVPFVLSTICSIAHRSIDL